jgi:hypothetical protein
MSWMQVRSINFKNFTTTYSHSLMFLSGSFLSGRGGNGLPRAVDGFLKRIRSESSRPFPKLETFSGIDEVALPDDFIPPYSPHGF